MKKTLNQQYRDSNSDLSFKDWVHLQQATGKIDDMRKEKTHENFGGDGASIKVLGIPIVIFGAIVLIGGIWAVKRYVK